MQAVTVEKAQHRSLKTTEEKQLQLILSAYRPDTKGVTSIDNSNKNSNIRERSEFQQLKYEKLALEKQLIALKNQSQLEKIERLTKKLDSIEEKLPLENESTGFDVWLGLVLACVALIVTGLGVIIALLAFFGYSNIKKTATIAAVKKSEFLLEKAIQEGQFNEVIYSAVERAVYRDILSEDDFPEEEEASA